MGMQTSHQSADVRSVNWTGGPPYRKRNNKEKIKKKKARSVLHVARHVGPRGVNPTPTPLEAQVDGRQAAVHPSTALPALTRPVPPPQLLPVWFSLTR
jgi:hypothetical protein